jgi:hypothetical protein
MVWHVVISLLSRFHSSRKETHCAPEATLEVVVDSDIGLRSLVLTLCCGGALSIASYALLADDALATASGKCLAGVVGFMWPVFLLTNCHTNPFHTS